MFRQIGTQNLTSCYTKQINVILRKIKRKYSIGCPCPDPNKIKTVHQCPSKIKITLCGANGQLGQIIAFLLKQSPLVNVLTLYDIDKTYGMAMDLSHIDTSCRVQSYWGCENLNEALRVSLV